jgi:hypothetical protein
MFASPPHQAGHVGEEQECCQINILKETTAYGPSADRSEAPGPHLGGGWRAGPRPGRHMTLGATHVALTGHRLVPGSSAPVRPKLPARQPTVRAQQVPETPEPVSARGPRPHAGREQARPEPWAFSPPLSTSRGIDSYEPLGRVCLSGTPTPQYVLAGSATCTGIPWSERRTSHCVHGLPNPAAESPIPEVPGGTRVA